MDEIGQKRICTVCGGELAENGDVYRCRFCDTVFSKSVLYTDGELLNALQDAERNLALAFPRFDDAEEQFEYIIKQYPKCSAGYWGALRAKYGIKLETDFDDKRVPSCYKSSYEDIRKDRYFEKAVQLAESPAVAKKYKQFGDRIAAIAEEWRNKTKDLKYDIFLCFKASDENGNDTDDKQKVQELYNYLIESGFNVFFSPATLNRIGIQGSASEPYIFDALDKAQVMVVYSSKLEYVSTTWMQNEWMRYLRGIMKGRKPQGSLFVAYRGFNPKDLPIQLRKLQGVDASTGHWHSDIVGNARAILETVSQETALKRTKIESEKIGKKVSVIENTIETVDIGGGYSQKKAGRLRTNFTARQFGSSPSRLSASDDAKMNAAIEFMHDGAFDEAERFFTQCVTSNDRNGKAYFGYFCCALNESSLFDYVYGDTNEDIVTACNNAALKNAFDDLDTISSAIDYAPDKTSAERILTVLKNALIYLVKIKSDKAKPLYELCAGYDTPVVREINESVVGEIKKSGYKPEQKPLFDCVLDHITNIDEYIKYTTDAMTAALRAANCDAALGYAQKILALDESNYDAIECTLVCDDLRNKDIDTDLVRSKLSVASKNTAEKLLKFLCKKEAAYYKSGKEAGYIIHLFKFIVGYNFSGRTDFIKSHYELFGELARANNTGLFDAVYSVCSFEDVDWHIRTLLLFADTALEAGHIKTAENYYGEALKLEEGNSDALFGKLRCLLSWRNSDVSSLRWDKFSADSFTSILSHCTGQAEQVSIIDRSIQTCISYILSSVKNESKRQCIAAFDAIVRCYPEEYNERFTDALRKFAEACTEHGLFADAEHYLRAYLAERKNDEPDHNVLWQLLLIKLNCKNVIEFVNCEGFSKDMPEYDQLLLASVSDKTARERYHSLANKNAETVASNKEKRARLAEQQRKEAAKRKAEEEAAERIRRENARFESRLDNGVCVALVLLFVALFCFITGIIVWTVQGPTMPYSVPVPFIMFAVAVSMVIASIILFIKTSELIDENGKPAARGAFKRKNAIKLFVFVFALFFATVLMTVIGEFCNVWEVTHAVGFGMFITVAIIAFVEGIYILRSAMQYGVPAGLATIVICIASIVYVVELGHITF